MKICKTHNIEAELKEGISKKTNKPYSFLACPEKVNGEFCKGPIIDGSGDNYTSTKEFEDSMVSKEARREYRIERMHAQEMSMMFLDIVIKVHPEVFMETKKPLKDIVSDYTDYFQKDLDAKNP